MAGVAITYSVEGAPQGGTQTVECSAPASLTAWDSLAASGPNNGFVAVTDLGGVSRRIGLARIVQVVGT